MMALAKYFILFTLFIGSSTAGCPSMPGCTCEATSSGDFRINCPKTNALNIRAKPEEYVFIECNNNTKVADYKFLPRIKFSNVKFLRLIACPFTKDLTFRYLMTQLGIENTTIIRFQNYGYNQIDTLHRSQFKDLDSVTRLEITGAGLQELPLDTFSEMSHLKWLDLQSNNLQLEPGIFDCLPNLEVLELAENNLTYIPKELFKNLTNLRRIQIWRNQLTSLEDELFDNLVNLVEINLSKNKFETLPPNIFSKLKKLKLVALQRNKINYLPDDLFVNNKYMTTIDLSYNNIRRLPSRLFANLPALEVVTIEGCNLQDLSTELFWGSENISSISLTMNNITDLHEELFKDNSQLRILDLSYNNIAELPKKLFAKLRNLRSLRLNNNNLTSIMSEPFQYLNNLIILNMANNQIQSVEHEAFSMTLLLEDLNLNNNLISFTNRKRDAYFPNQPSSPLAILSKLKKLFLSRNSIEKIFSDWTLLVDLILLDLSYNKLSFIEMHQFVAKDVTINLSNNNISGVDLRLAELISKDMNPLNDTHLQPNKFLMKNNPLLCDCHIYDLVRYMDGKMDYRVHRMFDIRPENVRCSNHTRYAGKNINSLRTTNFVCDYDNNKHSCPDKCTCYLHKFTETLTVNCSNQQLMSPPPVLPAHDKIILDLNDNNLPSLRLLFTNNSTYQNVNELYVARNNISTLEFTNLPTSLRRLELHSNNLRELDTTFLTNISTLQNLTLHGNPWQCNCDALDLVGFLQTENTKISFISNITCSEDNRALYQLSRDDLCAYPIYAIVIFTSLLLILFTSMALTIAYYRHKTAIKVWLFAHKLCQCAVSEEDLDEDKLYDAFVSFSQKDEEFVVKQLVPNLEQGEIPFKLCLHYRDWIAGEWIPHQIVHSVEQSRRTLVVLSRNFLDSVWAQMEFRSAHLNALKEKRARVIILKFGDIGPYDQLDAELRAYLSMNTYIEWGDRNFWDKLRYALPHKRTLTKNGQFLSRLIVKSLECQMDNKQFMKADMV